MNRPSTAGLEATGHTGRDPAYSLVGLVQMVVVASHPTDDPVNRSKYEVEYDCRDLRTGVIYRNCIRLSEMSGMLDGDDDVLHAASTLLTTGGLVKSRSTPAKDTDGDRVLVGFAEGSRGQPVILGVFRHSNAKYGAKITDGERRLTVHQGTSIEIKDDGSYVITGVGLVSIDGTTIKLGAQATQFAIRAADLNTYVLQPISSACATLSAAAVTAIGEIGLAPSVATLATALATILGAIEAACGAIQNAIAAFPSAVSSKVEVE
jgi:hypothetical protein